GGDLERAGGDEVAGGEADVDLDDPGLDHVVEGVVVQAEHAGRQVERDHAGLPRSSGDADEPLELEHGAGDAGGGVPDVQLQDLLAGAVAAVGDLRGHGGAP